MIIKLLIKLQSTSDIITNSSSVVFLCKNTTNKSLSKLKQFIEEYTESHYFRGDWEEFENLSDKDQYNWFSGLGGSLDIYSYEDYPDNEIFKNLKNPENYLIVDTDWSHYATIKWITENLNAKYLY